MAEAVITALQRQRGNRGRVSVFLDGEFAFGVNDDTAFRFGLKKGMTIDAELRSDIEGYDSRVAAKRMAERILARRMRSEHELRVYLRGKAVSDTVIDETIADLRRVQLIDDRAFAEAFVRDRLRFRPRSRFLLKRELARKGVAEDIIAPVLRDIVGDEGELESALDGARKFLRRQMSRPVDVRRERVYAYLMRNGYSSDIARRVLDALGLSQREP